MHGLKSLDRNVVGCFLYSFQHCRAVHRDILNEVRSSEGVRLRGGLQSLTAISNLITVKARLTFSLLLLDMLSFKATCVKGINTQRDRVNIFTVTEIDKTFSHRYSGDIRSLFPASYPRSLRSGGGWYNNPVPHKTGCVLHTYNPITQEF